MLVQHVPNALEKVLRIVRFGDKAQEAGVGREAGLFRRITAGDQGTEARIDFTKAAEGIPRLIESWA